MMRTAGGPRRTTTLWKPLYGQDAADTRVAQQHWTQLFTSGIYLPFRHLLCLLIFSSLLLSRVNLKPSNSIAISMIRNE